MCSSDLKYRQTDRQTERKEKRILDSRAKMTKEWKKKKKGMKLKAPKQIVSLWDRLKNFFTTIVVGYVGMQLLPLLPKLIPLAEGLLKAVDGIIWIAGKILGFAVTFIDWGYKLYDMGMGLIKNLVGEKGAKLIEDLMGHLNTLINGFLGQVIVQQVTQ